MMLSTWTPSQPSKQTCGTYSTAGDPLGIYDEDLDFPPDEYDCLIAPLLTRLSRGDGVTELSEFLWFELESYFGLNPEGLGADDFAAKLVAWYPAARQ